MTNFTTSQKLYMSLVKRPIGFLGALVALILLSPVFLATIILLFFANKGAGVFFTQERPGKDEKIFKVIKFKSMTDERDAEGNLLPDAQRLTKVGKFVRSTSIDELPQLINVLKGDMALIGPRPLLPKYLPYYTERERVRHQVRPGITGWAQVNGRNHVLWEERFELDAYYVEHLSLALDLKIVLTTIKNILSRKDIDVVTNLVDFDEYRRLQSDGCVFSDIEDVLLGDNGKPLIINRIKWEGVNIGVVRDDIYPFIGGGSKARKAVAYEKFLKENSYNAVVTCGGIQSNHNRAMALMCARNGWKCHICIQGTEERFFAERGNALLDRLSGATCELVRPEDTSVAMDRAMESLRNEGYNPYYVVGGGHNLPGGTCFVEAVEELKRQCDAEGWNPDYIFHASGTGSTQAGIAVGLDKVGWRDVKLVGVSVARQQQRGREVVVEFANMLAEHYGMPQNYEEKILFTADYLMGGYEQYTEEMQSYLEEVMAETGLMFDTTYSGKGFWGMMQEIRRLNLQDKRILFWHTGGLMNLMK